MSTRAFPILASALLVFFKNLNKFFTFISEYTGIHMFETWFDLGIMTAVIGLIVYTLPYVFVVVMITMARYRPEQTEAARDLGASAWRAFWEVEFPQIAIDFAPIDLMAGNKRKTS